MLPAHLVAGGTARAQVILYVHTVSVEIDTQSTLANTLIATLTPVARDCMTPVLLLSEP